MDYRLGIDGTGSDSRGGGTMSMEKPAPRLFEIALERAGARAETTLHVGDFYWIDVRGARAAGVQPVLLDAAWLYDAADCPRVKSLGELADLLETPSA